MYFQIISCVSLFICTALERPVQTCCFLSLLLLRADHNEDFQLQQQGQRFSSACSKISSSAKRLNTLAAALVDLKDSSADLSELSQSFVDWSAGSKDYKRRARSDKQDSLLEQRLELMESLKQQRQFIFEMKQRLIDEVFQARPDSDQDGHFAKTSLKNAMAIHQQQGRLIEELHGTQDHLLQEL